MSNELADVALGSAFTRYERTYAAMEEGDLSEILSAAEPNALVQSLGTGIDRAISQYREVLSRQTINMMRDVQQNAHRIAERMAPLWEEINEYDQTGLLQGAAAGAFSGETATGAAIGSFIAPGIGTAIGGAIGGMLSGSKIDKKFERNMDKFGELFEEFFSYLAHQFDERITPSFAEDLRRHRNQQRQLESDADSTDDGGGALLALAFICILLVAVGVGIGMWI